MKGCLTRGGAEPDHGVRFIRAGTPHRKEDRMTGGPIDLNGKKLIILGERDGVPAPVIEEAVAGLGGEVAYAATQCFV